MPDYQISIDQKTFLKEDLLKGFPKWEDLHYINVSDRSHADAYANKVLDKPLTAPNGFHKLGGTVRDLCGQEHIDKQFKQIINSDLPVGLVTFATITEWQSHPKIG